MTIGKAIQFIAEGPEDGVLRAALNDAKSIPELLGVLDEYDLQFDPVEFEEAYTSRLVCCQHEEHADQLKEFRMWWILLQNILESAVKRNSGAPPPAACADSTRCSLAGTCSGCGS